MDKDIYEKYLDPIPFHIFVGKASEIVAGHDLPVYTDNSIVTNDPEDPTYVIGATSSFSFFQFNRLEQNERETQTKTGWKFHASVAEEDYPRAVDTLAMLAVSMHLGSFKVAEPETASNFSDPQNPQAGKMFTFYCCKGEDWKEIIPFFEDVLRDELIKPGPAIKRDRKVPGSEYFAYRFATKGEDKDKRVGYNDSNMPDPYKELRVEPKDPKDDLFLKSINGLFRRK